MESLLKCRNIKCVRYMRVFELLHLILFFPLKEMFYAFTIQFVAAMPLKETANVKCEEQKC